jgi:hypothetical protein
LQLSELFNGDEPRTQNGAQRAAAEHEPPAAQLAIQLRRRLSGDIWR